MCIIFHNPDGRPLNRRHLRIAYENNPHGYGFMWVEGGQLNIVKGIAKNFKKIWKLSKQLSGFAYTLHLRWKTTGIISRGQCHPFKILDQDTDGLDFAMMHNGTLSEMPLHPEKSDTQLFSEVFRNKILEKDPNFILDYISKIQDKIGKTNRMVFMTSDHRTLFVNKHLGKIINGIWYSNTYSLQEGYRKKIMKPKLKPKFEFRYIHPELGLPLAGERFVNKRKPMPKWKSKNRDIYIIH